MSNGLIVKDASGNITVDVSDFLTRAVLNTTVTLNAGQSTTINVPGIQNNGSWPIYTDAGLMYCSISYIQGAITLKNNFTGQRSGRLVVFRV